MFLLLPYFSTSLIKLTGRLVMKNHIGRIRHIAQVRRLDVFHLRFAVDHDQHGRLSGEDDLGAELASIRCSCFLD